MRAQIAGFLLSAVLLAGPARASDPNDCNSVEWRDKRVLTVAKVTQPRIHFVKSPDDDDGKAEGCPAAIETCRMKSYLVAGDFVLAGSCAGRAAKPASRLQGIGRLIGSSLTHQAW